MTHGDRNGFPSRSQAWNRNAEWKDGALCTAVGYNSKASTEITRAQCVCCVWVHLCTRPWLEFSLALVLKMSRASQVWILSGIKVWKWVPRRGCNWCSGSPENGILIPMPPHLSMYTQSLHPFVILESALTIYFPICSSWVHLKEKNISPRSPLKPTVWW